MKTILKIYGYMQITTYEWYTILKTFDIPLLFFFISAFFMILRGVATCAETEDADAPVQ